MVTIIKEFSPTRVVLFCLTTNKEKELIADEQHPFDYDVVKRIWEDVEIH